MNLLKSQMERMYEAVSGYCSASPEVVRRISINHAVEHFCRDTGGVRLHLNPVSMNHDNGIYKIVAPFGGIVFDIKNVMINGGAVSPMVYKTVFLDDGRASVLIPHGNSESNTLEMDIAWRPSEKTTQMPEAWFNKNFDAIMHGAIAEVLSQVGTAWANAELATKFYGDYSRDVNDVIYETKSADALNGQLSCFDASQRWI